MNELTPLGSTPFQIAERGLIIPDNTLTLETAQIGLETFRGLQTAVSFGEQDLIVKVLEQTGEEWGQLIDEFDYSMNTLRSYMRVYRFYPTVEERVWPLTHSHYRSVCWTYLEDYERRWFLDWAVEARMGSDALYANVLRYQKMRDSTFSTLPEFDAHRFYRNIRSLVMFLDKKGLLSELPPGLMEELEDDMPGYRRLVLRSGEDD